MLNVVSGLLAGGGVADLGQFESIATVTVGSGGSSTITFSSIPSTYKHLQIRFIARSTRVNAGDYMNIRFNSDSGSNYSRHHIAGDGSGVGAGSQTSAAQMEFNRIAAANATSGVFGAGIIDVLEYANTNTYKTVRAPIAYDNNGSGELYFNSGNWRSTSAVNAISFTCNNDFAQYSSFALYGIKG